MPKTSEKKPLLTDNPPKLIWYSEKPGDEPRQIPVDEFMGLYRSHGYEDFRWTETIWFNDKPTIDDPDNLYQELNNQFESYLKDPSSFLDKFVVCFISEEVGFGLFAREAIQPYEILLIYSGQYTINPDKTSDYVLGAAEDGIGSVDAKELGGLARFAQHAPTSIYDVYRYNYLNPEGMARSQWSELSDFALRETSKLQKPITLKEFEKNYQEKLPNLSILPSSAHEADVATANVGIDTHVINGIPVSFFYSNKKIEAGQPVTFNYGSSYFEGKPAVLFNKKGGVSDVQKNFNEACLKAQKLIKEGKYSESYESHTLALTLLDQQCLPHQYRQTLYQQLQNNSGVCCRELEDYSNAAAHFKKKSGITSKLSATDLKNPEYKQLKALKAIADKMNADATGLYKTSAFKPALGLFQQVLAINEALSNGEPSLDAASIEWNISSCLIALEQHTEALEHVKKVCDIRQKLLPKDHADIAKALSRLQDITLKDSVFLHGHFGFNLKEYKPYSDAKNLKPAFSPSNTIR